MRLVPRGAEAGAGLTWRSCSWCRCSGRAWRSSPRTAPAAACPRWSACSWRGRRTARPRRCGTRNSRCCGQLTIFTLSAKNKTFRLQLNVFIFVKDNNLPRRCLNVCGFSLVQKQKEYFMVNSFDNVAITISQVQLCQFIIWKGVSFLLPMQYFCQPDVRTVPGSQGCQGQYSAPAPPVMAGWILANVLVNIHIGNMTMAAA